VVDEVVIVELDVLFVVVVVLNVVVEVVVLVLVVCVEGTPSDEHIVPTWFPRRE